MSFLFYEYVCAWILSATCIGGIRGQVIRSSGTGVVSCCDPSSYWWWAPNSGPLKELPFALTHTVFLLLEGRFCLLLSVGSLRVWYLLLCFFHLWGLWLVHDRYWEIGAEVGLEFVIWLYTWKWDRLLISLSLREWDSCSAVWIFLSVLLSAT